MRKSCTFIPTNGKASTYRSCITQKPKASSYKSQEKLLAGGGFVEVYTAPKTYQSTAGMRPLAGSIYFLLNEKDVSRFHQLDCDEVWYYHEGCGMRLYLMDEDGSVQQALIKRLT